MKTETQVPVQIREKKSPTDIPSLVEPPANPAVVIGTGLLTLDVVINSDANQPPRLYAGGTCGNVLAILSYLGWKALPVARLNGDTASDRVLRDLKEWGVDARYAKQQPRASTPIIVHQITRDRDGTPSHKFTWTCPRCGAWLPSYKAVLASAAREVASRLDNPQVFFMDRVSRGALALAEACVKKGAIIVFEPSGVGEPKLFKEALELTHILKYSRERVASFAELIKTANKPLLEIETRGGDGLRYRSRVAAHRTARWQQVATFCVPRLKDTAGAGDWCTAGIIHALGQSGLRGVNEVDEARLTSAFKLGQVMGAWACGFEGARGGMYSVSKDAFISALHTMLTDVHEATSDIGMPRPVRTGRGRSARKICPACRELPSLTL